MLVAFWSASYILYGPFMDILGEKSKICRNYNFKLHILKLSSEKKPKKFTLLLKVMGGICKSEVLQEYEAFS